MKIREHAEAINSQDHTKNIYIYHLANDSKQIFYLYHLVSLRATNDSASSPQFLVDQLTLPEEKKKKKNPRFQNQCSCNSISRDKKFYEVYM